MHRDVKPENLLVKDGKVKLCDFGLVKEIQKHPHTPYVSTRCYQSPLAAHGLLGYPGSSDWMACQLHGHGFLQLKTVIMLSFFSILCSLVSQVVSCSRNLVAHEGLWPCC